MKRKQIIRRIDGIAFGWIVSLLFPCCTQEQLVDCPHPADLDIEVVNVEGEDITDEGSIETLSLYIFDNRQKFLKIVDTRVGESLSIYFPDQDTLHVVSWGNLSREKQHLPQLAVGTPMSQAVIKLNQTQPVQSKAAEVPTQATTRLVVDSPDDLFYSYAIRGDQFTGEAAPVASRAEGAQPAVRALSAADEAKISSLNLLVFDADGALVLNESFTELTLKDGLYRLQTETLPGAGMQFYVIANADVTNLFTGNLANALKAVDNLNGLKALLINLPEGNNGLSRTDRLLMMGHTTVNVTKPYRTPIPLTLTFLSAKVTVKLMDKIPEGVKIEIKSWDIVNVPQKSYLMGRDKEDAVSKTQAADYLTTASKFAFEHQAEKEWSQTFYLLENRQGGRVERTDPTHAADKYPGMKVDDNDQRGKAWYAPVYATYLLVYGKHIKDGSTNDVLYKIYLGENAVNDYNLCRGKHYQYNVTINGLKDINIDTNVEWGDASFTVDKSDNFGLLDTHPDFRVLRIGGTAVDAQTPAYATVEVFNETGQIASDWLKVSPLNLYRHSVKQTGNAHQQFASGDGVGYFVRPQYAPAPSTMAEFKNATFAMTRKLTKIPFNQVAVCSYQDIVIYADALDEPDATRAGKVRVTYYKGDEQTGQLTYEISQTGPIRVSDNLFVERYEEAAMTLQPDGAVGTQKTATMQWGYSNTTLYSGNDRFSNGNFLTANAVYNTVAERSGMIVPEWTATHNAAYRTKYPSTGGAVTEPSTLATTKEDYFYPVLTGNVAPSSYFHPVFNASAARYCHEKNRDADGDGIISQSETFWYLPSFADMYEIKKSTLGGLNGTYWTSTEESNAKSWAFTFPGGTMAEVDKTVTNRVRCVRGRGAVLTEPTIESEEKDKTKLNLSAEATANGLFKITNEKELGFTWTVTSNVPEWLQIATDAKGTAAAATKTGTEDVTLYAYAKTANLSGTQQRTASLTLTRAGLSATTVKAIEVTQAYCEPIRGGNANSYMVSLGGTVSIPVERANESTIKLTGSLLQSMSNTYYQILSNTPWTADIVWESSAGLISLSGNAGTGASGKNFKVTAANIEGNAVVAVKNKENEILWSWHVWVTAYKGEATFTNNNGKRDFIFMDRALGAASAAAGDIKSCGLLYQWGRKDPFPGPGQEGGSWSITDNTDPIKVYNASGTAYTIKKIAVPTVTPNNLTNATRNPDTFYHDATPPYDWFSKGGSPNNDLWSGGTTPAPKSVFDPCPVGWRVAPWLSSTSPFAKMNSGSTWGSNGRTWPGTDGYFPASGVRHYTSGEVSGVSKDGYYWSGSPSGTIGYSLYFNSGKADPACINGRSYGFPVRCCQDNL